MKGSFGREYIVYNIRIYQLSFAFSGLFSLFCESLHVCHIFHFSSGDSFLKNVEGNKLDRVNKQINKKNKNK